MDHFKIPGLSKHHSDRKHSGIGSSVPEVHKPVKLDLEVESPPLISYNPPAHSSGALFSAQMVVDVTEANVVLDKFDVQLYCSVNVKKPVSQHCPECTSKTTELKKWAIVTESRALQHGKNRFPISYHFLGQLPATTHADLAQLEYHLAAEAKTSTGEIFSFNRELHLGRSIAPGPEKHSIRVFPPTNLTAHVTLNPIVHPIGEIPVSLRLSGITSWQSDSQIRWRLRKMNWRIEEHQKMISPACSKHAQKVGGEGKGILHEDTRTIGDDEVDFKKTPWKSDFDAGDVDCEFKVAINPALKPTCDVTAPNGLSVTHNLVVEMVVAEEWVPLKRKTHQPTPTGSARILRMQFHLVLTERGGLGVSWDEETPPVYQNVPESPPPYMAEFDLAELGHMEDLQLDDASHSPATAAPSSPRRGSSRVSRSPTRPSSSRGRFTTEDLLEEPPELTERQRQSIDENLEPQTSLDHQEGSVG